MFWDQLLESLENTTIDIDDIKSLLRAHKLYACLNVLLQHRKRHPKSSLNYLLLTGLIARFCGFHVLSSHIINEILSNVEFITRNRWLLLKYIPWFGIEKYEKFLSIVASHIRDEQIWWLLLGVIFSRQLKFKTAYKIFHKYLKKSKFNKCQRSSLHYCTFGDCCILVVFHY